MRCRRWWRFLVFVCVCGVVILAPIVDLIIPAALYPKPREFREQRVLLFDSQIVVVSPPDAGVLGDLERAARFVTRKGFDARNAPIV